MTEIEKFATCPNHHTTRKYAFRFELFKLREHGASLKHTLTVKLL